MSTAKRARLFSLVFFCALGLSSIPAIAQSIFATLTGVVSDASGAPIPKANVVITNASSGDVRRSVTNSDGYFSFTSVPTGAYTLEIEAAGFQKYQETGLAFTGSEKRNVNVAMKVGNLATEIDVVSNADVLTPVDSGEKSATLTTKQLQDFSVVGRSAAEFIKVLPGFSPNGAGVANRAGYNGEVIGINGNGEGGKQSAIGNYSANGLGAAAIDITADGAHVSDPGCNCASPVNPNTDMIQEFKVQTSNFSAENPKGPVVMNSISKAGGRDFHGAAYFYARHFAMNSGDWKDNQQGIKKPENKYFFPGGQIGGPVLIPGTRINKDRNKLFFFTAYEYYYQTLDTGLVQAKVPTAAQLNGDFSQSNPGGIKDVSGNPLAGSIIPAALQDPTGKALLNLYPKANRDPNTSGGYNYVDKLGLNQNSYQWLSRVDYSISDNTKLFVRYNLQNELQQFPIGLWWRNGGNQVPYPTPIEAHNTSSSVSASLTHVFNPSLTNEFIFGYTYINFPNSFADKNAVDRTKLSIPFQGVFKNGVTQIPSVLNNTNDIATIFNPGGFEAGNGTLFATKYLPSFSNNVTKVFSTHTIKAGVYWERIINTQPANNNTNGQIEYESYNSGVSTGNYYSDLLQGYTQRYNESNKNPVHNEAFNDFEFFAQDSWKATRRLTLEYGMRFQHLGNWYDRGGIGFAVWDPGTYNNATAAPTDYVGLQWNKRNSNVPLSGFSQRALFYAPRFGLAYDVFGTGKTVVRGGWGAFRYHTPQFTTGYDIGYGVVNFSSGQYTTFNQLSQITPQFSGRQSVNVLDSHEDEQPLTYSYSFTISQKLFGGSLVEASYVGNQTKYLPQDGRYNNVNAVPYGALFGVASPNSISTAQYDAFRPLANYQDLQVARNNLYANYNGLQLTYAVQRGRLNVTANYTFSKALGVTPDQSQDKLNLNNNYGPLAYDRRHVFNAAYSVELPNALNSGNKWLRGVVNGWQISGITQLTSGVNLAANSSENFNLNTDALPGGSITGRNINGTDSIAVQPILLCDPRSGLKDHQYINGSCFGAPTPGHNGPALMPEIFGPMFFDSDLSLFKNIAMGERRRFQFRFSAYNFLNHPLDTFFGGGDNNLKLVLGPNGLNQNSEFGFTNGKTGRRVIQLAAKFYF